MKLSKSKIERLIIAETKKFHHRLPRQERSEIFSRIEKAIQLIISEIVKNSVLNRSAKG